MYIIIYIYVRVSSLALKATFVCTELMGWTRAALERMMPAECADFLALWMISMMDIQAMSRRFLDIPGSSL